MRLVNECPFCNKMFQDDVLLPENALQMRASIIVYLSNNPMGIGGGTLTVEQIAALLEAVLPS